MIRRKTDLGIKSDGSDAILERAIRSGKWRKRGKQTIPVSNKRAFSWNGACIQMESQVGSFEERSVFIVYKGRRKRVCLEQQESMKV